MADLLISFPGSDASTGNRFASELAAALRAEAPSVEVAQVRDDPRTQDFGATLVLLLGTAAARTLAGGIATWLSRRRDPEMRLRKQKADGTWTETVVTGRLGRERRRLIEEFLDAD